jgi:hypothetical protein
MTRVKEDSSNKSAEDSAAAEAARFFEDIKDEDAAAEPGRTIDPFLQRMLRVQRERDRRGRVERKPLGSRDVLTYRHQEPGYAYRYFNHNPADDGERIKRALDAGWSFVEDKDFHGADGDANRATPVGSCNSVAVGDGMTAYLMRIDESIYKEDQKKKQERISEGERALLDGARAQQSVQGDASAKMYGEVEASIIKNK